MHQLLDLLAGHLAATGHVAEHPLAVGTRLVHHLAALLLGHLQLGLGVGRCVAASAGRFDLGLLAHPLGLVGGLAQQTTGAFLGADLDLRRRFACRLQDARCLFTQHAGDDIFVECRCRHRAALVGAHFAFEEPFTFLQARQFGGDHAQKFANLGGFEALAGIGERRRGYGTRRRGIGARERQSHQSHIVGGRSRRVAANPPPATRGAPITTSAGSRRRGCPDPNRYRRTSPARPAPRRGRRRRPPPGRRPPRAAPGPDRRGPVRWAR